MCLDCGSSVDSESHAPSRLVPGHRLWADRRGRHVLGLIEDYNALRKRMSEAQRLTADLDTQIHDSSRVRTRTHTLFAGCVSCRVVKAIVCFYQVLDQFQMKGLSSSVNTMQQVLEEATRLLKLLWRVSLPSGDGIHTQQVT